MRLARTLSSLCVACVMIPFLGADPATQPAAPLTEDQQLRQRIAQLEAEVADLRTKLERAGKPDAVKSSFSIADELKIDYVPAPARPAPSPNITSRLVLSGTGTTSSAPTTVQFVPRPSGETFQNSPKP